MSFRHGLNYVSFQESIVNELEKARVKAKTSSYWKNWCRVYLDGEVGSLEGACIPWNYFFRANFNIKPTCRTIIGKCKMMPRTCAYCRNIS